MVLQPPPADLFFSSPLQRDERQFYLSMPERESCFFVPVSNPLLHINQLIFQVNSRLPPLDRVANTIWMFGNDLHVHDRTFLRAFRFVGRFAPVFPGLFPHPLRYDLPFLRRALYVRFHTYESRSQ